MANVIERALGITPEKEKTEASAIGAQARLMFAQLHAHLIVHGDIAWITPPGGVQVKLSREGTAKLMEKIADAASLALRRKAPRLDGETGRFFRSAFGVGCRGESAPLMHRVCGDCEAARILAPLGLQLEDLI